MTIPDDFMPAPSRAADGGNGDTRELLGMPLVIRLNTVLRVARTHEASNQAFQRQLAGLLELLSQLFEHETDVVLASHSDYLFLNGMRIRAQPQVMSIYHSLLAELERRQIGGLRFQVGLSPEELQSFIQMLVAAEDPEAAGMMQDAAEAANVVHATALPLQEIEKEEDDLTSGQDPTSERRRARRMFWRAVLGTKKIVLRARQTGRPDLRHAKRLVQPIVDGILRHEYSIVGLTALKDHDEYTYAHCVNVSVLSIGMGNVLGLPRQALADLGVAALLHDIGKMDVPAEVLRKPTKLQPHEWQLMRQHPIAGVRMLARMPGLSTTILDSMRVCLEHHMNFDRTGYPEVPGEWGQATLSRIVAAADCFDAMTAHRSYHRPWTPFEALQYFMGPNRVMFDPAVLWALVRTVGLYPPGTMMLTSSGHVVLVLQPNPDDLRRPNCRVLVHPDGTLVREETPEFWSPLPENEKVARVLPPEHQISGASRFLAA